MVFQIGKAYLIVIHEGISSLFGASESQIMQSDNPALLTVA